MKGSLRLLLMSVVALPFTYAQAVTNQGPPDITVSGVVDANVINTISASQLEGSSFDAGVSSGGSITLVRAIPFKLRSISTSIAPDVAGELCTVTVSIGEDEGTPIGLALMSNGQASTVSRNYSVPIDSVSIIQWKVRGDAAFCRVTLAVAGEVANDPESTLQRSTAPSSRFEVR